MSQQDEINAEILECARYGEHEDLKTYIEVHNADVNHVDAGGNTALHKACANGHLECIRVLLAHNARRLANESGNYPEHWAAQNGHTAALQLLFDHYKQAATAGRGAGAGESAAAPATGDLDVLRKNSFGRSVLTEAFQSKDSDCIALCLNHPSAAEERLIPEGAGGAAAAAGEKVEAGADGSQTSVFRMEQNSGSSNDSSSNSNNAESNAVTHEFWFYDEQQEQEQQQHDVAGERPASTSVGAAGPRIRVRELPIAHADTPFGDDTAPENDTTGLAIWPASILLAQWVVDRLRCGGTGAAGKGWDAATAGWGEEVVVMELGAGCGLPGITAATHLLHGAETGRRPKQSTVYITDIHAASIANAKHNVMLNGYEEVGAAAGSGSVDGTSVSTYTRRGADGVSSSTVVVQPMWWNEVGTYPPCCQPTPSGTSSSSMGACVDLLLGSDLVYEVRILEYLVPTVLHVLKPGGRFLYLAPEEGSRQGMAEFIQCLQKLSIAADGDAAGNDKNSSSSSSSSGSDGSSNCSRSYCIRLTAQYDCPEQYYRNPFPATTATASAAAAEEGHAEGGAAGGGMDRGDQYVLHFYDLAAKRKHICYEFTKIEAQA